MCRRSRATWLRESCALTLCGAALCLLVSAAQAADVVLLSDDFEAIAPGPLMSVVGAHTEYHYMPEAAPKGHWAVSTFSSDSASQLGWEIRPEGRDAVLAQTYENKRAWSHPMVVAGDELWEDYTVTARYAPDSQAGQSGVAFRYRNDRCYYWFGVNGGEAILKMVRHERAFHEPLEKVLARRECPWTAGQYLTATVTLRGNHIRAQLDNGVALEADDATYPRGKVALMADVPTRYSSVTVTATEADAKRFEARRGEREAELRRLQAANPKPVLWRKLNTDGFGVGRNLRFGDLDGDGRIDVLIGQVLHHGPGDSHSEVSCLTAMTFDGKMLWRIGEPDPAKNHLTNDVGFQIHDLNGDGRNEVIYCMNFEIIVAEGATGRTLYKAATPEADNPKARFPRILGDCLYFCDLRGTGHPRDIIIKDRYWQLWALDDKLNVMWTAKCTTGHYPFAKDVDGDGRDELAIGYSLFDDDGKPLWSLDKELGDHADGVAIVRFRPEAELRLLNSASDEGMVLMDLKGRIIKHHRIGHAQNPAVANFRDDLPGLEMVSINFWRNQGILHFYDAEGNIYHECEPNQFGSMCLPINWTGRSEELFVHSPNVQLGGMFDGWGRRVVLFPDDGHPDMCNAVLDITGDCRDEVVVWNPQEIWVYTQDDNPKTGTLYKPVRNPLYNYSNYQASVSSPGW